jgi:hypothetical protein
VERTFLWNALLLFLWNAFFCGTSLFMECCYKETTATQEVENINKVDKEKVEEESKLALVEVQVVDDTEDVEEEPSKVPTQQAKPQEIAATKNSLRLQEQNALATAKKSKAGGAEDRWK